MLYHGMTSFSATTALCTTNATATTISADTGESLTFGLCLLMSLD